MQHPVFYKQLINVSVSECEDTTQQQHTEENNHPAPIELFSEEPMEQWTKEQQEMMGKIIALCGFSLEQTRVHHFTNTAQLATAFNNETTNYILLFCDPKKIKTIHFRLKKIGFSAVGNTKVYYNPTVSNLANNKEAKLRLWNAMKAEFNL